MNFLKNAVGGDNFAKVAGQKAGEFVEQKVDEVFGGKAGQQQQQQQPQQPQQQQEKKKGGDEGFGLGDALQFNNKGQEGGNAADELKNLAGGLFK